MRPENPPKDMGSAWPVAQKELIYSQTLRNSLQLISQGIQEVSNIALDTQVGLQKKLLVNEYLLNTYCTPGTILDAGNIQVKKEKISALLKFTFQFQWRNKTINKQTDRCAK